MLARRRSILAFSLLVPMAGELLAQKSAPSREPFAVFSVRSLDDLLSDIRLVTGSRDKSPVDQAIAGMTQGKGLAGIDGSKPFGAYFVGNPGEEPIPQAVVAIPVKDTKALLGLLGHPSPETAEVEGLFQIATFGRHAFGKISRGYCFLSEERELVESIGGAAGLFSAKHDISIVLHFSKIPQDLKDLFMSQMESSWAEASSLPGLPAAYLQGHEAGRRYMRESMEKALRDADKVELGITLDGATGAIVIEWEETARSGTELASMFAAYGNAVPSFGGMFSNDAALSLACAVPIPAELRDVIAKGIASGVDQARGQIDGAVFLNTDSDRKSAHQTLDGFLKAFQGLDTIDLGLVIDPTPSGTARFAFACKVASGRELASAIDRLVKVPGAVGEGELRLDVARHGGARIHALGLPAEVSRVFGKGPAHIAIRNDAVYLSVGEKSLEFAQQALDKTANPGARRPPVSLRIRPSRVIDLFAKKGDVEALKMRQAFQGKGDSLVFEVLPVKNGLRGKMTFGEGFLNLLKSKALR